MPVALAQSFEQLTGLVYQVLLHVTGFTHCCLDLFVCVRFICIMLYCMCMHVVL